MNNTSPPGKASDGKAPSGKASPVPPEKKPNEKPESKFQVSNNIGLIGYFESAREALIGIPADLLAGRGTVYDVFTKNNRLRGLGLVFVCIALLLAFSQLLR